MKIIDFSKQNSIINKYMAEMRDKDYQSNRLLFRNNIMRVGELIAYELSKTLDYETRDVQTPLGTAKVNVPTDKLVLGTIFRAVCRSTRDSSTSSTTPQRFRERIPRV